MGKGYSGRTSQHSTWSLRDEPGRTEEEEQVALCRRAWERLRGLVWLGLKMKRSQGRAQATGVGSARNREGHHGKVRSPAGEMA